jgi:hypothetical protein
MLALWGFATFIIGSISDGECLTLLKISSKVDHLPAHGWDEKECDFFFQTIVPAHAEYELGLVSSGRCAEHRAGYEVTVRNAGNQVVEFP